MTPEEEKAAAERAAAAAKVAKASRPKRGDLVTFRHIDPLNGQVLEGAAVVTESPGDGGGVWLAPLAVQHLFVDPENVAAVTADDLKD